MAIQLPPQAYTRDTMVQAYEWLQSQPPSIRELASSPDSLVSLFMQARRRGGAAASATHPASSQAFKQDLKNLAEGLRQFEGHDENLSSLPSGTPQSPGLPNMQSATGATASPTVNVMVTPNYSQPSYAQPGYSPSNYPQANYSQPNYSQPAHHQAQPVYQAPPAAPAPSPQLSASENEDIWQGLDTKSHEMVRRVMNRFNLSNEKEALRMLIALGFDKVREMLPKG